MNLWVAEAAIVLGATSRRAAFYNAEAAIVVAAAGRRTALCIARGPKSVGFKKITLPDWILIGLLSGKRKNLVSGGPSAGRGPASSADPAKKPTKIRSGSAIFQKIS